MKGETANAGAWVTVQRTLLQPNQRAPGLPEDTARQPLVMRVRGHLENEAARLHDEVTVQTMAGRRVTGELVDLAPRHPHGFGRTDPDVLASGLALRRRGGGG